MTYQLQRLAAGSYDLVLDGEVIGSVVRNMTSEGNVRGWRVELLDDHIDAQRPDPFIYATHQFGSLGRLSDWLGQPEVVEQGHND